MIYRVGFKGDCRHTLCKTSCCDHLVSAAHAVAVFRAHKVYAGFYILNEGKKDFFFFFKE